MESRQVYCEHPVCIVNPRCVEFVLRHWNACGFLDEVNNYVPFEPRLFGDYQCKDLKKYVLNCLRRIHKYHPEYLYISGLDTSECIEFFLYVPCGHCLLCNHRKRVALASKCAMESQSHDNLPLFITLTYDGEHLPSFGLCYSDVQKFLKRLRVTLQRKYAFSGSLRYVCCGEYGSKTARPHYHLLIWEFPSNVGNLFQVDEFIRSAWNNGLTQTKRCFNSDAGFYVGKYMSKGVNLNTPDGCNPPFHVCSINLGFKFVESVCRDILKDNPEYHDFKYCDKFDGKLKPLPLISYFIRKMFPTRNQAIPCEYRNALFDAVNTFNRWRFMSCVDKQTFDLLKPLLSTVSREEFYTNIYHEDWLQDAVFKLAKSKAYSNVPDDCFIINEYISTLYFGSLISDLASVDLKLKASIIGKQNTLEFEKEKF